MDKITLGKNDDKHGDDWKIISIDKETEKAICLKSVFFHVRPLGKGTREYEPKFFWIPKSQIYARNARVFLVKSWIAQKAEKEINLPSENVDTGVSARAGEDLEEKSKEWAEWAVSPEGIFAETPEETAEKSTTTTISTDYDNLLFLAREHSYNPESSIETTKKIFRALAPKVRKSFRERYRKTAEEISLEVWTQFCQCVQNYDEYLKSFTFKEWKELCEKSGNFYLALTKVKGVDMFDALDRMEKRSLFMQKIQENNRFKDDTKDYYICPRCGSKMHDGTGCWECETVSELPRTEQFLQLYTVEYDFGGWVETDDLDGLYIGEEDETLADMITELDNYSLEELVALIASDTLGEYHLGRAWIGDYCNPPARIRISRKSDVSAWYRQKEEETISQRELAEETAEKSYTVRMSNETFEKLFPEDFRNMGPVGENECWQLDIPSEEEDGEPGLCVRSENCCGDSWPFGSRQNLLEAFRDAGMMDLLEEN